MSGNFHWKTYYSNIVLWLFLIFDHFTINQSINQKFIMIIRSPAVNRCKQIGIGTCAGDCTFVLNYQSIVEQITFHLMSPRIDPETQIGIMLQENLLTFVIWHFLASFYWYILFKWYNYWIVQENCLSFGMRKHVFDNPQ